MSCVYLKSDWLKSLSGMAADGGVMLSLDEALSELGNLFYTFGGFLQVCCLAKTPPPLF